MSELQKQADEKKLLAEELKGTKTSSQTRKRSTTIKEENPVLHDNFLVNLF